jgi:phosphopantothenoylcysteine decarboxylase/phosphopantothenate--cysteine ligase
MKLTTWLKKNGVTAREFASRVDTTEATISRIRNGRAQPSMDLAGRIAAATSGAVTANDFLKIQKTGRQDRIAGQDAPLASVLLIIGGGIAAYKCLELIRRLRERNVRVRVILTRAGAQFVTPLSVGAIAGESPFTDLFDARTEFDVGHIRLAREADAIIVAPATADLMAKMANGHADDLATAVLLASDAPVLLAPAMNPHMWAHPATQRNLAQLAQDGIVSVGPNEGEMAESGEAGLGRMAEVTEIIAALEELAGMGTSKSLKGKHVLVTSGPTREPIDPVRYIANRSSGKQGHAIAAAAARAGADVTLVSGPVRIPDPAGVKVVKVETASQMLDAVQAALPADIGIFAAAVSDWRMPSVAAEKIKKTGPAQEMTLELVQNPDILSMVGHGENRPGLLVGFAAETEMVVAFAKQKRIAKGCDWIVANDVSPEGGVMGGEKNTVHLVTGDDVEDWPELGKDEVARRLVERIAAWAYSGSEG